MISVCFFILLLFYKIIQSASLLFILGFGWKVGSLRQHLNGLDAEDAWDSPKDSNSDLRRRHGKEEGFKDHSSQSESNSSQDIPNEVLESQGVFLVNECIREKWFFAKSGKTYNPYLTMR